ncbi:amidohydrolase family protein [Myxococcota bacterium]|nr:amidohydrolase family protein [Myxococcota bacterium]
MPTPTEAAPPLVLRGATVHPGDGRAPFVGEVVVEGARLSAVRALEGDGPRPRAPRGARVIDVSGRHLAPGFVDAHVHMGVMPEGFPHESKDLNEMTAAVTPQMRALDGIWPGDTAFNKARAAGVTTVCVLPGSANVVGGTGVVLKTTGRNVERMALRSPACLKVAFGYTVKHSHGLKANRMPLTRMGIAALFRQAFDEARLYAERRRRDPEAPADAGREVLCAALRRELPVRAHCSRSDDILTALRLAREYGLDLVLDHGYEAHFVLDEVRAAGAAVVLGPAFRTCGDTEALHMSFESTRVLDDAGVLVAHMTDHPIIPVEYLSLQAGLCVRAGMAPERALATVTHNPARILGLGERLGRLAPGFDADLLVLDGPPLSVETRVLETYIDGRVVHRYGDPLPVPGAGFGPAIGDAP